MRVLLIIVFIGAALGCWYWTTTPEFAFQQVKDAIKKHDLVKFQKYVDEDEVASNLVDDCVHSSVGGILGHGLIKEALAGAMLGFIKPAIVAELKEDVEHAVSTGSFAEARDDNSADAPGQSGSVDHVAPEAERSPTLSDLSNPSTLIKKKYSLHALDAKLGFHAHAIKTVKITDRTHDSATASLILHNEKFDEDIPLTVSMSRATGTWRIIRITDFPRFVGKLVELQTRASQYPTNSSTPTPTPSPSAAH